jgi:hypothetical protein
MAMHRPRTPTELTQNHNQKRSKGLLEQCIAELADCANVSETARRCNVTPWLMYYWKRRSEDGFPGYTIDMGGLDDDGNPLVAEFHEAWDAAVEIGNDYLEQEAQRRAVEGYNEPVVHKGIQAFVRDPVTGELELDEHGKPIPLTVRRYSDRLLEILLKARRPEKFRENMKIEASIAGGVLAIPQSDQANLSADDWAARFRANDDGKTIEGTPVYPHEMPANEVDPETFTEKRTGRSSVRAVMERKLMEKAEQQDPVLEQKKADLVKWQMEKAAPTRPEYMQSGPMDKSQMDRGTKKAINKANNLRNHVNKLMESDIDPLA